MKTLKILALPLIAFLVIGCGDSSTNPVSGTTIPDVDGDFVGLASRTDQSSTGYQNPIIKNWKFSIDSNAQTFSAQSPTSSSQISGTIDNSGAFIEFDITNSNNSNYPNGYHFSGVGISDKLLFTNMPPSNSNYQEISAMVKKDTCPTSNQYMVWHRLVSPVLANPWAGNDIVADLIYNASSHTLRSYNSWTTTAGQATMKEASFLNYPATITCNNGYFTAIQQIPLYGTKNYKGYITSDGYVVSAWGNIELAVPKKSITNINNLKGNYVGYLIVNPGNSYGLKAENSRITAYIDFSSNAQSNILTINEDSVNDMEFGYINIKRSSSAVNYPIDGEVQGDFNIFTTNNSNHPLVNANLPLPNTLVPSSTNIDLSQANFSGKITCSAYENVSNSNSNLIICEAHAHSPSYQVQPDDNLFTIILITGKLIPQVPCNNC